MSKTIVGIDPGSKGYIAVVKGDNITTMSIADSSNQDLAAFFHGLLADDPIVVMEEVHAVFGSSAKATFSFGKVNGFLLGLIVANNIPYHLVQPKVWQKEIWITEDKVQRQGKVDTKATSLRAAKRLYPTFRFTRTERCTKADDNLVDAVLIATYGKRKNL